MCVSRFRERQQTRPPGDLPSGYITAILHHVRLLSIQKGLPVGSESFDVSDAFSTAIPMFAWCGLVNASVISDGWALPE